jgi:hypothetical protein
MTSRKKPFSIFEHCPALGGPVELNALVVLRTRVEEPAFVKRSCPRAGRCGVEHGDHGDIDGCLLHALA